VGFSPELTGEYQLVTSVILKDSTGVDHPFASSTNVTVVDPRTSGVFLTAVTVGADFGKTGVVDLSKVINENLDTLKAIYPVSSVTRPNAPSAMPWFIPNGSGLNGNPITYQLWIGAPGGSFGYLTLLGKMDQLCAQTTGCRAMVGLVNPAWLVDLGTSFREIAPKAALIATDNFEPNQFVLAHEIGHLALFEHADGVPAGDGYNVLKKADKRYTIDNTLIDFMDTDPVEAANKKLWISSEHYNALGTWTGIWAAAGMASFEPRSVTADGRLLVSGAISPATGQVALLPWYQMEPGEWQSPIAGPYSLLFLDASNSEIAGYSRSFAASAPTPDSGGWGMFTFTIPYPSATARVQICRISDHALLQELVPAASAPTLSINSPSSGVWHGAQTITWQTDPGPRYFAVSVSSDNGVTWVAQTIDLPGSSYTLQTTALPDTTEAWVRVSATDGLRTSTTQAGPFTINNPPLVAATSPSHNAVNVGIYEPIWATFRDSMDPATLQLS
jgi:hypothetical protein